MKFAVFLAASLASAAFARTSICTIDVDGLQIVYRANVIIQNNKTVITAANGELRAGDDKLPLTDRTKNRFQDIVLAYNDDVIDVHADDHKTVGIFKVVSDVSVKGLKGPLEISHGTMTCDY